MSVEGPLAVIGPKTVVLRGGMTGIYVKSTGVSGDAKITLHCGDMEPVVINMQVTAETREDK